ncbi:unnamed protein product [Soboliphyme baturini]|uniref:SLC12 domain-containing protein n=1 Tax=Soboliphyme baturini TaxID=241478 RepID=A0A183IY57_9BILA|nr:unnamed protein product [Soboliphyme baturini]
MTVEQYQTESIANSKQYGGSSDSIATMTMGIDMDKYIFPVNSTEVNFTPLSEANVGYCSSTSDVSKSEQMVERAKKSMHIPEGTTKPSQRRRNVVKRILRRLGKQNNLQQEHFATKIRKGTIDVWWLYDDGGLTILLPHLLTLPRSYLEGAKLRVFFAAKSNVDISAQQKGMSTLLKQFRINSSSVEIVPDMEEPPHEATMSQFNEIVEKFKVPDCNALPQMDKDMLVYTDDQEMSRYKEKTNNMLRTSEVLRHHSSNADLIILTFPVPRRGRVSAGLYLSWLEMLTAQIPPVLLIRGNQEPVLTLYT